VRAVSADGVAGDWLNLGTLVRLPEFGDLRCPRAVSKQCILSGDDLFLADSFSSTADFTNAVEVPAQFTGTQLSVPHPANGLLYLKLRDDPATVQTLTLPVTPLGAASAAAATHAIEQANEPVTPASTPASTTPATAPQATTPETPQPAPQSSDDGKPAPQAAAPSTPAAAPTAADQTNPR
jgi:hypothetical protein